MKQSKNLTTGISGNVVRDHLRTSYNVTATPRLIADWNWNRFSNVVTASNPAMTVTDGYIVDLDPKNFPIESIIEPLRPSKGILKARAGEALVASSTYTNANDPKFYIGDPEDIYKYWTSPFPTDANGNMPLVTVSSSPFNGQTTCQPTVNYGDPVNANKIVIRIDNTWATPKDYDVQVLNDNNVWGTVAGSNPNMNTQTGLLTLYYNGTAWVTTRPATLVTTRVMGVRFRVSSMKGGVRKDGTPIKTQPNYSSTYKNAPANAYVTNSGKNSSLSLIAIEAHMEVDLSDRLISVDDSFDISDPSQLYPIGTITSNQASFQIDNTDGLFNYDNSTSPYYQILDKNVECNLEYIYTINGYNHSVQQFKMYTESWNDDGDGGTLSVELTDYSRYLKDIKPSQMMYENLPVTQLIWRFLDSVGFADYEIQKEDLFNDNVIPVFWTTGEETVWEVLNGLAEATQTAIYFNAYGKLQVRTRDAALNASLSPQWALLGNDSGSNLADIINLDTTQNFEANKVKVTYKNTSWKVGSDGKPAMSIVWEPEGSLVVRSTALKQTFGTSNSFEDSWINLGLPEVAYWPYESVVQIDGELIRYKGKHMIYYTGQDGNTLNQAIVTSHDEVFRLIDQTPPEYRYKNNFTGYVKIEQRGLWGTTPVDHPIGINGWRTKMIINDQTSPQTYNNVTGLWTLDSVAAINSHPYMNGPNDLFFASRDFSYNGGYKTQGARMFFAPGFAQNRGGFGFSQSGNNEDGYYVELRPTSQVQNRANGNEITLYSRKNREWKVLHAGVPIPIAEWTWYDVDAVIDRQGGNDVITVFINGLLVARANVTNGSGWKQPNSAKMSMYSRGKTAIGYEYIYGVNDGAITPANGYGFFDLKYGGVRGGSWEQLQVWQIGYRWGRLPKYLSQNNARVGQYQYQKNVYFFDEFGPYVHEVREFDVKFDPAPVQYSQLFTTNEWYARNVDYFASPFKANFTIANIGRVNAVLNGEDNLTYGGGQSSINQMCVVLGRDLVIADDKTVEAKDDIGIRRRGVIETELSSQWLQSEAMAQEVADWIVKHWGRGVEEVTTEIFGNPLFEIGDVVSVTYAEKNMQPSTHTYFVTGIKTDFNNGVGTTLTLRRVYSTARYNPGG